MKQQTGVLYITYDGLSDAIGQSQVIPYLKALAKQDIVIHVLSFEKKHNLKNANLLRQTEDELHDCNIKWCRLTYHKNPCLFSTLYDVICGYVNGMFISAKYRLKIVHARGYVAAFIASWIKKSKKIKFIFDMRGFWVEEKVDSGFWSKKNTSYKIAKAIERDMVSLADKIVVLTEAAKSFLKEGIKQSIKNIEVIPTCVDQERFKPLEGEGKDFLRGKTVILYSGSVGTFYRFNDAVRFFQMAYEKEKRSFFLALINNNKEIAEESLKMNNVPADSYKVLSVLHSQVPDWLKEADVSLMFYSRDNSYAGCCPTRFAESLACGVPVLVNKNIGDCDGIIMEERVGFILEDFMDSEYESAMVKFLSSLKERDALRRRCRSVAERLFSLDSGVERYLKIYNSLL